MKESNPREMGNKPDEPYGSGHRARSGRNAGGSQESPSKVEESSPHERSLEVSLPPQQQEESSN